MLNRTIFYLGWLLSPFTFWNDAFINIPLSYVLANLFVKFIRVDFLLLVLIFYWLSNAAGILLMFLGGKNIFREGKGIIYESGKLILAIVAYSLILVFIGRTGLLKPFVKL